MDLDGISMRRSPSSYNRHFFLTSLFGNIYDARQDARAVDTSTPANKKLLLLLISLQTQSLNAIKMVQFEYRYINSALPRLSRSARISLRLADILHISKGDTVLEKTCNTSRIFQFLPPSRSVLSRCSF